MGLLLSLSIVKIIEIARKIKKITKISRGII
jgi:hypothetical protein